MLHDMNVDNAFATMVETMLPRFSPADIGLVITLDMRASNFKTGKDMATMITFVFQRPGNYTKVMAFREDFRADWSPQLNKETEVDLASDHDSCWRSDGFNILNKDWMDKENKVGHPRNKNVSFFNSFSIFRTPKYVHFKSFKVDRDNRKVTFVIDEFINPAEMLSFMKKSEKNT